MSPSIQTRIERDSLGERELPADLYYGIQTARAVENFPVSGWKPYPSFVTATVQIKKAAARVNASLGALDPAIAKAVEAAAVYGRHFAFDRVVGLAALCLGQLHAHQVVGDQLQGVVAATLIRLKSCG